MKRKAAPAKGAQKTIPAKSSPKSKPKSAAPSKPPAPSKTGKPKTAVKKTPAVTKSTIKSAVKSAAKSAKSSAASLKKTLKATVEKAVAKTRTPAKTGKPAAATVSKAVKKVVKGFRAALEKITPAKTQVPAKAGKAAVKPPVKAPVSRRHEAAKQTNQTPVKAAKSRRHEAGKPNQSPGKTAPPKAAAKIPAKAAPKKAPAKALRPKAFPARDAEKPYGFPAGVPELPESYGEDRLVLMTQDPEYLHAYWEITPQQYALSEAAKRGGEEYREALRLNWVARDLFAPNFALLPVALEARKVYLRVPYSGLSYQVEIGWVSEQGHFISILGRSNRSDAPESWKQTRQRLQQAAGERTVLEYNLSVTQPLGSSELGRTGVLSTETGASALSGDWDFEGPGSLSSSASSGAAVRKIPPAALAAKKPSKRRR